MPMKTITIIMNIVIEEPKLNKHMIKRNLPSEIPNKILITMVIVKGIAITNHKNSIPQGSLEIAKAKTKVINSTMLLAKLRLIKMTVVKMVTTEEKGKVKITLPRIAMDRAVIKIIVELQDLEEKDYTDKQLLQELIRTFLLIT